jgi:nucleoside-diphosphate-sugar epimerase
MPTAFVTGGTGFVGFNLILQLLADNWEIVALHRPTSDLKNLRDKKIQFLKGPITDRDSLPDNFPKSVDVVFHVAGNTNLWSPRNQVQYLDNVVGTQNMVEAALKHGAKRFIHTSSTAAYGHHTERINEKTTSNAISSPINYHRTKYLAEMEVRKGIEKGLDAVILNPSHIMGPHDYHNWSQLFMLIDRQKLPGVPEATQTFCHVNEVAKAHITAFHKGRCGENYILGGVDSDYLGLVQQIGDLLGKPTPKRTTPKWVLQLVGRLSLWGSYITGKEPTITPEKAYLLTNQKGCDSQKAQKELDYNLIPLKRILEDCYRWMLSEGMIGNL